MSPGSNDDPRAGILFALRWLLRRLARLALSFGITYPTLEALLKRCYIESATQDFALPDRPQTDSRITLLTGLNRSDLRRLRSASMAQTPLPASIEWRAALRWGERPFVTPAGKHARLPRLASVGGEISFEALVQSISTDIPPASLLTHWVSAGVAVVDDGDCVCFLMEDFYKRLGTAQEQAGLLAFVAGDLMQGYIGNMPNPSTRPLQVRAHWLEGLSPGTIDKLDKAMAKVLRANEEVHALGTRLQAQDAGRKDASQRYLMCAFRYHADSVADPAYPLPE